jgi:hypothetical protein
MISLAAATALGAGANLTGGVLGYLGQKETNKTNVGIAQNQMHFQERMSSTAYQRAMADMRTAGLNPMLAYAQGGASSPQGSAIAAQNPGKHLQDGIAASVSSALQARKQTAEIKNLDYNNDLLYQQARKSYYETNLTQLQTLRTDYEFQQWLNTYDDKTDAMIHEARKEKKKQIWQERHQDKIQLLKTLQMGASAAKDGSQAAGNILRMLINPGRKPSSLTRPIYMNPDGSKRKHEKGFRKVPGDSSRTTRRRSRIYNNAIDAVDNRIRKEYPRYKKSMKGYRFKIK